MAINPGYLATLPGIFKLLHIIFGIITIGCGGHSFESEYIFERVFLWSAVSCFVISFLYFLAHLASDSLSRSQTNKGIDMLYHLLGGLLLITGGSLMIASVKKYNKDHCGNYPWSPPPCQSNEDEKLAGGSFAIINGVFYILTTLLVSVSKSNDELEMDHKIQGYPYYGKKAKSQNYEDPS